MRRAAHLGFVALFAVLAAAQPLGAQRKPDAPKYEPPKEIDTYADDAFRDVFRKLGFDRMAIFVNVHVSDVVAERHTEATNTNGAEKSDRLVTNWKEDQTNSWRITRGLAEQVRSFYQHRDLRLQLVGPSDIGKDLELEMKAGALRDEQEAGRRIGKAVRADIVVMVTLTKAIEPDASGARYGGSFYVVDARRNDLIDSWSWDFRGGQGNELNQRVLRVYARSMAARIHDAVLKCAQQAAGPHGQVRRYQTLRFAGLPGNKLDKLADALRGISGVDVRRQELETKGETSVATFELDSAMDGAKLAAEARKRAADVLGTDVTQTGVTEGNIEFVVGGTKTEPEPHNKPAEKPVEKPN